MTLPTLFVILLGFSVAIFAAFRSDVSYSRWTEGAQAWYHILAASRTFGRLIVTFVKAHKMTPQYDERAGATFQREMIYRHIAWVNMLRVQLRGESDRGFLKTLLPEHEYTELESKSGPEKTNSLMKSQGTQIYDAIAAGTLQGFDSSQLESRLSEFEALEATCERIKEIPIPRQYDYFTRLFISIFIVLVPLGFIGLLSHIEWAIVPITMVIAFVLAVMERIGVANESPFENRITDVPMSTLCVQIERDLREQLNETNLPPLTVPKDGYLW